MGKHNDAAAERGYRISRRAFLISSSAAALAACAPSTTGNAASSAAATTAAAAATAGPPLKLGQLLPFTKVYAELGNSMKRSTDLYLKLKGNKLANRPVTSSTRTRRTTPRSASRRRRSSSIRTRST